MADIKADIVGLAGYSAHADQSGLLDWVFDVREDLRPIENRVVFIQHGGDVQRLELAKAIGARAREKAVAPKAILPGDPDLWFDLERGASEISEEVRLRQLEDEIARLSRELMTRRSALGSGTDSTSVNA